MTGMHVPIVFPMAIWRKEIKQKTVRTSGLKLPGQRCSGAVCTETKAYGACKKSSGVCSPSANAEEDTTGNGEDLKSLR